MKKFVLLFLIFSCVCFSCSNDTKKTTKTYAGNPGYMGGNPSKPGYNQNGGGAGGGSGNNGNNQNGIVQGVFSGARSGTWSGSLQDGVFRATFNVDETIFDVNGTLDRMDRLTAVGRSMQLPGSSITLEGAISGGKDIGGTYTLKQEQGGYPYRGNFTGRIVKN